MQRIFEFRGLALECDGEGIRDCQDFRVWAGDYGDRDQWRRANFRDQKLHHQPVPASLIIFRWDVCSVDKQLAQQSGNLDDTRCARK